MAQSNVHIHEFPNGLTLLAETMPAVRSASFTILIPAGAVHDPPDQLGMASMLAEWITRGAGQYDAKSLLSALDNLGVTHGESAQSAHISIGAATLGRNVAPALRVFADVVRRPHLSEQELEPIRALLLQSLRSLEDDPASKVMVELRRRHYPDPLNRPVQGTNEGLAEVTMERARTFHNRYFRPNGMILAAAGKLDWPALRDEIDRLFGDWPRGVEPEITLASADGSNGHVEKDTQQTQLALAIPSVVISHDEYYQARAMAAILGGYSSSRLFTEVREKRGLCYSISAGYESYPTHASVVCHAGTTPERAQQTLDVMFEEIEGLRRGGVGQAELDTMRAGLKSSLVMQQESTPSRAGALASDWYFLRRIRSLGEISAALDALTTATVSNHCANFALERATLVTLGPSALAPPRQNT